MSLPYPWPKGMVKTFRRNSDKEQDIGAFSFEDCKEQGLCLGLCKCKKRGHLSADCRVKKESVAVFDNTSKFEEYQKFSLRVMLHKPGFM